MELITAKEAAEKWGVTLRRVQGLCNEGSIKGATRFGRAWMIPSHAILPSSAKKETLHIPMPRRSPFLDMTDLYNRVGKADECSELLVNNPEAYALFKAQIAYRRGDIAEVYKQTRYFLDTHSGFYAILGAGMLLSSVAIWSGDVKIWYEAKKHICEAPSRTEEEREIISLALAVIDSSIYNNNDFPEWFSAGNFCVLPPDSHPAVRVYYVKYLYMSAFALASGKDNIAGIDGLALMRLIPRAIEPLITQAVVDGTVIPEIYLRLSCAVAYHNSGETEKAIAHVDRAVELALADNLLGILAENVRHFDGLLEERITARDPDVLERISDLSYIYTKNWSRLCATIKNSPMTAELTAKEREVAKLVAFGFTNKEIGAMKHISESTVKQTVLRIVQKTGIKDRSEFPTIL